MTKTGRLKKMLIKNGVILVVIVGVLGGLSYALSGYADSKLQEATTIKADIQRLDNQIKDRSDKLGIVERSLTEYRGLKTELDSKKFSIDRAAASNTLATMRGEFRLGSFILDFSPETAVTDPILTKFATLDIISSPIKITCTALTDLHLYAFLDALPQRLPGFVRVSSLKMTRSDEITEETIAEARKGTAKPAVTAEIHLMWFGVKPKAAAAAPGTPAADGAPAAAAPAIPAPLSPEAPSGMRGITGKGGAR